MVKPLRKSSTKSPPIFSNEFIIQNHADIVSCVAMVFVGGLMFQATSPLASIFITLQHNTTEIGEIPLYLPGIKDWASIFFYSLICIVIHAIIQEYGLDKISKKLHLSKSKLQIFQTSGQLIVFYLISTIWGIDILIKEQFFEITKLWSEFPAKLTFMSKLYLIIQLSYQIHEIPELYFQKTKKEDLIEKLSNSIVSTILIAIPYFLNYNRLLICLIVLHHISELISHLFQLLETIDKQEKWRNFAKITNYAFQIVTRLSSTVLAVLTLWYGLAKTAEGASEGLAHNYNTGLVRLGLLGGILVLQMYLFFNVVSKEWSNLKENNGNLGKVTKVAKVAKVGKKDKKLNVESDLPEVDQNTNKNLRKQKIK